MSTFNHYSNNPEFYNELFQGTDYWNTYQGILKQYSNTPQDTFWGSITGGNSQRLFEHYQNRDAALNALLEQMRTDQYNSTESAMLRDRAAGLNPDLLGVNGGEPSQSIGPTDQPSMMDSINGDAQHGINGIMSVLQIALGAYSGIMSSLNLGQDTISKEIANNKAIQDFAEPFVTQSFAEAFKEGLEPAVTPPTGRDAFSRLFSKKLQKHASAVFDHLYQSDRYDLQRRALQNANDKFDADVAFQSRELFESGAAEQSVGDFVKEMVNLGLKERKLMLNKNISVASKEKMLAQFREESLQKMIKNYRNSGQNDIMTGLILAGMLESSGISQIGDYKTYLMLSGDQVSKDASTMISNAWNGITDFFGFGK